MPLQPGEQLGPYAIVGELGRGGMGEVYRGRDTRLDRDVAIKVIPASLARDPDRVARFEREAKAVAALSHPNILTVHDIGTAGDTLYVVMELLAGESLGERLRQGPLPVRKACEVGSLVARGLSAAHDKGIVHRDLKPDNIFLTDSGQVKILDFGLAREVGKDTGASETRAAITDAGAVLGTVGYMAPEQVRGQAADARADLFALGTVLFEMLSGQRAFARGTAAETMTAILNDDAPDVSSGPRQLPPALDRIVRHCLEKNPAERFQTARDVAFALDSLSGSNASGTSAAIGPPVRRSRERVAWTLATASLAALATWLALARPTPAATDKAYRATILLPEGVTIAGAVNPGLRFSISPDGQKLAFIGETKAVGRALWVQSLADGSAVSIDGSQEAEAPFWSPDSRLVGYSAGRRLWKVDSVGGKPMLVAETRGTATWSPSGQEIVVADQQIGVRSISVVDGSSRELVAPGSGMFRMFPTFFQGPRRFVFGQYEIGGRTPFAWYGSDLDAATPELMKQAQPIADHPNLAVASGYVLWVREHRLLASSVESDLQGTSDSAPEPTVIATAVDTLPRLSAAFSVSQTGVLVYQTTATGSRSVLKWFKRDGQQLSQLGDEADYSNLEISPDGKRLLVSLPDSAVRTRDIWMLDLNRGVPTRMTFDRADERSAVWSTDGQSITFRGPGGELFSRPLGRGEETPVVVDKRSKDPDGWSSDGKHLLFRTVGNGNDLWVKPADKNAAAYPLVSSPYSESYGQFSPDGRWVAYVSDETGGPEVYVTSFPSGQEKIRVSSDGGLFPRWRKDGKELFYLGTDGKMMVVTITASASSFDFEAPKPLFQTTVVMTGGVSYVVSDDGQRFLINSRVASASSESLAVIFNWPALIPRISKK